MGMLSAVAVLSACLALSAAQLLGNTLTPQPQGSGASTAGGTGTGMMSGGPLDAAMSNNGPASPTATGTGSGAGTGTDNNAVSQMFRNPLMSYGLMGGDNLNRAFMMPFLSRLGASNTANYYYLRGGMDKYASVMMSDMLGKAMARSMGMNPMLAAMFAGQMTDAPDNYALSNMLLNGGGLFSNRRTASGRSSGGGRQAQGTGLLPTGAASPFMQSQAPSAGNWFTG